MIRDITIPAKLCKCDICGHSWISIAPEKPVSCANRKCRSREWDGKKPVIRRKKIKLPSPRKTGRPKTITAMDTWEEE